MASRRPSPRARQYVKRKTRDLQRQGVPAREAWARAWNMARERGFKTR